MNKGISSLGRSQRAKGVMERARSPVFMFLISKVENLSHLPLTSYGFLNVYATKVLHQLAWKPFFCVGSTDVKMYM